MDIRNSIEKDESFQLISLAIQVVDRIRFLHYTQPDFVNSNEILKKTYEMSIKWNELFFSYASKLSEANKNE